MVVAVLAASTAFSRGNCFGEHVKRGCMLFPFGGSSEWRDITPDVSYMQYRSQLSRLSMVRLLTLRAAEVDGCASDEIKPKSRQMGSQHSSLLSFAEPRKCVVPMFQRLCSSL